jgi:hypothetical protein
MVPVLVMIGANAMLAMNEPIRPAPTLNKNLMGLMFDLLNLFKGKPKYRKLYKKGICFNVAENN